MFCSKCGKSVQDGDMFCWNCGAKMPAAVQPKGAQPQEQPKTATSAEAKRQTQSVNTGFGMNSTLTQKAGPQVNHAAVTVEDNCNYDISNLPSEKPTGVHAIYPLDFMLRMTGKENIPLFIYLILNVILIGLVVTLVCTLPVGWGLLVGLIMYIGSISIALSPIGEFMLRRQTGCRKIDDAYTIERLEPLFREVYYKAKKADPSISNDVRLFINDEACPNAFATGRKTVCVTQGLLSMSDEEIKATLGHEFGHLSHKDTDRILVVSVGNTIITGICWLIEIGAIIFDGMVQIFSIFTGSDEGIFVSLMSSLSRFLTMLMVALFMKVWTAIGVALCMKTSRGNEYQADEFSVRLGYADGLCELLNSLGIGPRPKGLFASLSSSHPHSADRIAHIREVEAQM